MFLSLRLETCENDFERWTSLKKIDFEGLKGCRDGVGDFSRDDNSIKEDSM